jgi:uncharacterized SAM-binding protein YcdF (DUF218 family)
MTYTQPLILVCAIVSLVGFVRIRRCKGSWLVALGVSALVLLAWPPVDWLLSRPLEARYPIRPFAASQAYQAIVVLSGNISPPQYERPYALASKETYERCEFAAWIYKKRPSVPVLACGGTGTEGQQPYSLAMREILSRAGVPEAMIWTEERSHSTYENAAFGSEILRQHGVRTIALVVEAKSMPRAEACFRKQGIAVVPAPCAFREWGPLSEELIPNWKPIFENEVSLHEAVGLAWYRLRGWI